MNYTACTHSPSWNFWNISEIFRQKISWNFTSLLTCNANNANEADRSVWSVCLQCIDVALICCSALISCTHIHTYIQTYKYTVHSDKQYSRETHTHTSSQTRPSIRGFIPELLTSVSQAVNALYGRLMPDLQWLQTHPLPTHNRAGEFHSTTLFASRPHAFKLV